MITNNYKAKEKIVKYIAIYTIYKILLEFTYIVAVSYWYSYLGFTCNVNISKCVLSYVLFYLLMYCLPRDLTINGLLLNTFFSISTVPMLSFYWLADKKTISIIYVVLFFLIFNFVAKIEKADLKITFGKNFNNYDRLISILFICYCLITIYMGILRGGIDVRALSLSTIYSLRDEESSLGGLGGYLLNWCAKSFFPMFATYYLYRKKYCRLFMCFGCQIFLYLCYGFKAYLLSAFLTIIIFCIGKYAVTKHKESNIRNLFVFIIALIPCCCSRLNGIIGNLGYTANNTYSMRMLFEPARIENGYFEYFSNHNKLYFSEGLIGKVLGLKYPYDEPIGFIVTKYMNGLQAVSNSNTGIVADSYSQLGLLGIVLIALLAGLLIVLIKRITINLPNYFVGAALFYPVVMLNDNPLLTNILTNGWIVDVVLLILFENACSKNNEKVM